MAVNEPLAGAGPRSLCAHKSRTVKGATRTSAWHVLSGQSADQTDLHTNYKNENRIYPRELVNSLTKISETKPLFFANHIFTPYCLGCGYLPGAWSSFNEQVISAPSAPTFSRITAVDPSDIGFHQHEAVAGSCC